MPKPAGGIPTEPAARDATPKRKDVKMTPTSDTARAGGGAPAVSTCLWFDGAAEEAAAFYVALIPGSAIGRVYRPAGAPAALVVEFTLAGTAYMGLNGGPEFPHTEAASIVVSTANQGETDRLWAALTAGGGSPGQCGWLKGRYGLSWQIVPEAVPRLVADPDPAAVARVMAALMGMGKIDIAELDAARRGRAKEETR